MLTKRDMQNMQCGGARGLELRTFDINTNVSVWLGTLDSHIISYLNLEIYLDIKYIFIFYKFLH